MCHGIFLGLILLGALTAGTNWDLNHGLLFTGAGLLMAVFRPQAVLPKVWWAMAALFVALTLGAFLPVEWFGMPEWRRALEELGVDTGGQQVVQVRQAAEMTGLLAIALGIGLWLAGQRVDSPRGLALAFALAVAGYALVAQGMRDEGETFGFFPNRNHTATLLSMGSLVGLGLMVQAVRDRRWVILGAATLAAGWILWALFAWSISRAGVVLLGGGGLAWVLLLGRGYLGGHAGKLLALIALATVGGFWVADVDVKSRLEDSSERLAAFAASPEPGDPETSRESGKPGGSESSRKAERADGTMRRMHDIDFRVPTWIDTWAMIRESPWVGVGAGQFRYVFPQFRNHTAAAGEKRSIHPESSWLWLAAETGVPAALTLLGLVAAAGGYGLRRVRRGRARALRLACLIAALLVAGHSIFDVPGHRVPLAWAAAWLFSLALPPASETRRATARWPWRIAGATVFFGGIYLLMANSGVVAPTTKTESTRALRETARLYREDQALMRAALDGGAEVFEPEVDLLEKALERLDIASRRVPLDPDLRRITGMIGLQYDDKQPLVKRAFAIERLLLPTTVSVPLEQAAAWGEFEPDRTAALWKKSLARAERNDKHGRSGRWTRDRVEAQVRAQARSSEILQTRAERLRGDEEEQGP